MEIIIIPVTPFAQNCSLIWDAGSKQGAFVDPGGDIQKLICAASDNQVTIEKIILTHGHLDHVGGTVELAKYYDVPIVGPHLGDKFWLDALMQQSQMFGFPPATPFAPNQWLSDNDTISVGELTLEVLHCPGHTPGHVVLVERISNKVIVGDVIFAGSIGRTDFPQGDHQQLLDSINAKILTLPDDMVIYPGHGPTTTVAKEKASNPYVASQWG
ncbi:MBL fold metallo-hydrolase [Alteromonas stellipolaris]|uniref:MBL fold metallo-hydrolase n=1 Tax=Alteromonas stellipolaris TaxID=233316 RepID=UPI0026E3E5D9|nr:MBL fold metallo-hydrolase [Alteromonas stellipolaris]MDO6536334.1 MBL fold metallo-hydrolase [Alteromonas stellipolaris]MDO6627868.1 MBL fold metallo-hydrolase [Alteromonas stellipolaris]